MTWQRCLNLDLFPSDAWGNWLAGFVAADGCFNIDTSSEYARCTLRLELRDDDTHILQLIQSTLGIGTVQSRERKPPTRPTATWLVRRIGDIIHVVIPLFEKYPLRAKKQLDFEIWARAARIIHSGHHKTKAGKEEIATLKQELMTTRQYNGDS